MDPRDRIDDVLPFVNSPGQYIGGEWNSRSATRAGVRTAVALVMPEPYARGADDLLLQHLYAALNDRPRTAAERFFSPWPDLEERMRRSARVPWSLESRRPLEAFDLALVVLRDVGCFTNLVNLLDLARWPVRAADRGTDHPPVIALGPGADNPLPVAPFVDLVLPGEPEEAIAGVVDRLESLDTVALDRSERIASLASEVRHLHPSDAIGRPDRPIPAPWIPDLDALEPATAPVIPFVRTEGQTIRVEVSRGVPGEDVLPPRPGFGPPLRMRSRERIVSLVETIARSTGYDSIQLLGAFTEEDPHLDELLLSLEEAVPPPRGNLALPPLPVAPWSHRLLAPLSRWPHACVEWIGAAGTERVRSELGRPFRDEELLDLVSASLGGGIPHVRLRFLLGAPGEGPEDVDAIASLVRACQRIRKREARGRGRVLVDVRCFTPRPHTPWERKGMAPREVLIERIGRIREIAGGEAGSLRFESPDRACLRTLLLRGDRKTGDAVLEACRAGARLDNWDEPFRWDLWVHALQEEGLDPWGIATRVEPEDSSPGWGAIEFESADGKSGHGSSAPVRDLAAKDGL
jgi:hypothetical protein